MAWYTRTLITGCATYGCKRPGTVRVYNTQHTDFGTYCAAHGGGIVERKNKEERDQVRRENKAGFKAEEARHA